jgi:hypothetical protein
MRSVRLLTANFLRLAAPRIAFRQMSTRPGCRSLRSTLRLVQQEVTEAVRAGSLARVRLKYKSSSTRTACSTRGHGGVGRLTPTVAPGARQATSRTCQRSVHSGTIANSRLANLTGFPRCRASDLKQAVAPGISVRRSRSMARFALLAGPGAIPHRATTVSPAYLARDLAALTSGHPAAAERTNRLPHVVVRRGTCTV